jgi:hypothetical protein
MSSHAYSFHRTVDVGAAHGDETAVDPEREGDWEHPANNAAARKSNATLRRVGIRGRMVMAASFEVMGNCAPIWRRAQGLR